MMALRSARDHLNQPGTSTSNRPYFSVSAASAASSNWSFRGRLSIRIAKYVEAPLRLLANEFQERWMVANGKNRESESGKAMMP